MGLFDYYYYYFCGQTADLLSCIFVEPAVCFTCDTYQFTHKEFIHMFMSVAAKHHLSEILIMWGVERGKGDVTCLMKTKHTPKVLSGLAS